MIKKVIFTLLTVALVAVGGQSLVYAAGPYDDYALADGTVTDIQPWSSMSDIKKICKISYDVTIDGQDYSGKNDNESDFCYLAIGDTVKIKYLKSDPRKHEIAKEFEINQINDTNKNSSPNSLFFAIPFGVVFVSVAVFLFIIFNIVRASRFVGKKLSDNDGDGLLYDDKPATAEQKKLVEEGFRKLGVYHDVKKKMTRSQARETLREIDKQLSRKTHVRKGIKNDQ
ncbi:MAG: DUF3592 domain-containing protein [Candidatus Nomurabacteria bacterium]|jgi:hypothetical protein|nr:DUF3592 domain-containing protein [Candidatus Nomurabacteria bacterium]